MSPKLALKLIIILFVFEIIFGYAAYKIKVSADSVTSAVSNSTSQNAAKFGVSSVQLPAEDVAGSDIPGITRYKYLVRTKYLTENGITTIEYQTHVSKPIILSFYKTQLAKAGWILQSTDDGSASFNRVGKDINIIATSNGGISTLTFKY